MSRTPCLGWKRKKAKVFTRELRASRLPRTRDCRGQPGAPQGPAYILTSIDMYDGILLQEVTLATPIELRKEPAGCCAPPVRAEDRSRTAKDAPVFAALADEVRLQIVRLLARSPALCACEIQEAFDLGQPTI